MTRLVDRGLALLVALCLVLTGSCGGSPSNAGNDESEARDVGGSLSSLVEGRTVEVEKWANGKSSTVRESIRSATDPLTALSDDTASYGVLAHCGVVAMYSLTAAVSGAPNPARAQACATGTGYGSPVEPFMAAAMYVCAAHWALHFAEATSPSYIVYDDPVFWVFPRKDRHVPPWDGVATTTPDEQIPANLRYVIHPPTASDAATWALAATELFRSAALIARKTLSNADCLQAYNGLEYQNTIFKSRSNLLDDTAANLVDASTGMIEASEKAQKFINAAAAARRSGGQDSEQSAISGWRGRQDSRLEVASIFTPVSEHQFETVRLLPVWEMTKPDVSTAVAGSQPNSYYTTSPDEPVEAGYARTKIVGWAYPPNIQPVPAGTVALRTWRSAANTSIYLTTTNDAAWVRSADNLGSTASATPLRIEGYVASATSGLAPTQTIYRSNTSPVETFGNRRYIFSTATTAPTGYVSAGASVFAFSDAGGLSTPGSAKFPVAALPPQSQGDKRAEEMLRVSRVNPCMSDSGRWCLEALGGTTNRDITAVATDLLNMAKRDGGNVAKLDSYVVFLDKHGIKQNELRQAAHRIVREAEVLGRQIVPDPNWPRAADVAGTEENEAMRPRRVFGTEADRSPVPAAYLYARTAGHVEFNRKVAGLMGTSSVVSIPLTTDAYPKSSVISAAHHLHDGLTAGLETMTGLNLGNTSYARVAKEAKAFLAQHISGGMRSYVKRTSTTADRIDSVALERSGLPYGSVDAFKANCSAWLGEAGLSCALTGNVGGEPCDATRYRFTQADGLTAWQFGTSNGTSFVRFGLDATEAPPRNLDVADARRLLVGDRIYAVCATGTKTEVVHAVELTATPTANEWWWANLPPMSTTLLDALQTSLSADPESPAESGVSCAGVPYNVKVALENELTEAASGRDDIESSFAHYLGLARKAADQADRLGEELVEQGIQMDMRAEQAREELEDLCGGVIDVAKLEAAACSTTDCDVMKLLERVASSGTSVTGDPILDSDLEGVAHCLGIQSPPVWAALGDQSLCIWQYYPTAGSPLPPPMVCPSGVSTCAQLTKVPKVYTCDEPNGNCSCGAMFRSGMLDLGGSVTPTPGNVYARKVTEKLNVQITAHDATDRADTQDGFACTQELWLRQFAGTDGSFGTSKYTQMRMKAVAEAVGYEEDIRGMPMVTANGKPWMRFGDSNGPIDAMSRDFDYPCERHPKLTSADCSGARANSLFCGTLDCANIPRTANRMRSAVLALKGMTGASYENVVLREVLHDQRVIQPGLVQAGVLPNWWVAGKPGTNYYLSEDLQRAGFQCMDGGCQARLYRPDNDALVAPLYQDWRDATPGLSTLGLAGWAPAVHLWDFDTTCRSGRDQTYLGCGDLRNVLRGKKQPVRSQIIFDSICPEVDSRQVYVTSECSVARNSSTTGPGCPAFNGVYSLTDDPAFSYSQADPGGALSWPVTCKCKVSKANVTLEDIRNDIDQDSNRAFAREYQLVGEEVMERYGCGTHKAGTEVPWEVAMDAIELACGAEERNAIGCGPIDDNFRIDSVEDLPKVRARVQCSANTMQDAFDHMYLPDVPSDVVDALQSSGIVQTYPQFRGAYGEKVAYLGAQLVQLTTQSQSIVQQMRDIATLMDIALAETQALDLNIAISDVDSLINSGQETIAQIEYKKQRVRTRQAIFNATTACVTSMLQATSNLTDWATGKAGGATSAALATCANSAVQIQGELEIAGYDSDINDVQKSIFKAIEQKIELGQKVTESEKTVLMAKLSMEIGARLTSMYATLASIQAAQSEVHGTLAALDVIRNRARRNAAKVLMLENDDVGRQYAVNSAMRARMNTLRVRYERARDNAVRLAYIARRAVEQRLGVEMSLMGDDMTLVQAPNKWVDKLCSLSAIDYDAIREGKPEDDTEAVGPDGYDYAEGYIGDWLTQLENFVESYSIDYHFDDGEDFAVVSLRDEIVRAKADAVADGWNELYYTDGSVLPATGGEGNWSLSCGDDEVQATLVDVAMPGPYRCTDDVGTSCRGLGDARAVMLFSKYIAACEDVLPVGEEPLIGPARLHQSVDVGPGDYWLSWHQLRHETALTVMIEQPNGATSEFTPTKTKVDTIFAEGAMNVPEQAYRDPWLIPTGPGAGQGWVRYFKLVHVPRAGKLRIGFVAPLEEASEITLAAPQLEFQDQAVSAQPKAFFPTRDTLGRVVSKVEDRFGEAFRGMWEEGYEYYCPGSGPCATDGDASNLPRRHYRELKFSLDLAQIERGETIHSSGFARGNINYRFDQLALNVVGTALKDCENSEAPSTCYGSNFVQFSLRHGAPFRVRNHAGDTVEAPLFVGRMQQAKALLAERYLSNPPSGSDEQLLSRYWRDEFRGRPLDGNFVLRIYDDEADGFDFNAVEDIQIALKYRYWTPGE